MSKFKTFFIYFFGILVFVSIGWFANTYYQLLKSSGIKTPFISAPTPIPTPLAKYTIEKLAKEYPNIMPVEIKIGDLIKKYDKPAPNLSGFSEYKFYFEFDPTLTGDAGQVKLRKVSGVINIPQGTDPCRNIGCPIILMLRGYVDPTNYFMGEGTEPAASVFASNGFITIAPDFLGYGESDKEATDIFESRFQTYTTAIALLKTIGDFKDSLRSINSSLTISHQSPVFIWAHSNGGQVALTTLETTGVTYPTVLWAPVSKPFPYSILYYTDDASDSGKFLRSQTANFETTYNSDLYSLTNYLNLIKAPIQLNQGTSDTSVPVWWSDDLSKSLLRFNINLDYLKYTNNDHNMRPNWSSVIDNNLQFYKKFIK